MDGKKAELKTIEDDIKNNLEESDRFRKLYEERRKE